MARHLNEAFESLYGKAKWHGIEKGGAFDVANLKKVKERFSRMLTRQPSDHANASRATQTVKYQPKIQSQQLFFIILAACLTVNCCSAQCFLK